MEQELRRTKTFEKRTFQSFNRRVFILSLLRVKSITSKSITFEQAAWESHKYFYIVI